MQTAKHNKDKDSEDTNRGKGNQHRGKNPRYSRKPRNKEQRPEYVCPFCGNSIRDLRTAIARREDGVPAHFDCVIKDLSEQEDLSPDEKICYLGKGSFGIIRDKVNSMSSRFFVRKRIQYEDIENPVEWRKNISEKLMTRSKR